MNEDFVTKGVFNSDVRRIGEKMDATVARIELKTDAAVARMEAKTDAYMEKMEMKLEAAMSEMKAQNASFREYVSNELSDMNVKISTVEAKVDNISCNVALIMTVFGLAFSAAAILIQYLR